MYGTTFPGDPGGHSPDSHAPSSSGSTEGGYQKKPWDGQKKPWTGGGGDKAPFKRPVETDMTLYKPYAVTANRDCPPEIQAKFIHWVQKLEGLGYTLRTGGMDGIEDDVEKVVTKKEVILPFRDFAEKKSKFTYVSDRALAVAKQFFPSFDTIKKGAQLFLAKNARVVMGNTMAAPSLFLLCWTEDGCESIRHRTNRTGFTGHPIAIASAVGLPIFNLGSSSAEQRLQMYLDSVAIPA